MPRVPEYGERRVSLRPQNQGQLTGGADASAFGGNMGRDLIQFGQGVTNFAHAVDWVADQKAKADAKQAWINGENEKRDLKYNPETGYLNSQGKNALEGRQAYEDGLSKIDGNNSNGLSSRAQKYYDQMVQSSGMQDKQQAIVHAAQQSKRYLAETSSATIQTYADNAIAAYNDENIVNENIAGIRNELKEQSQREGWGKEVLDEKLKSSESAIRTMVLGSMADAKAAPETIKDYFEKHKGNMSGADIQKLRPIIWQAGGEITFKNSQIAAQRQGSSVSAAGLYSAASLLRRFEGFQSGTYYDVNAYRTGFGSDTITRADGSIVRVQKGMQVTREDAERDLFRRLSTEFIPSIVKKVGSEAWSRLPPSAQGALASVTYNYGSLPERVARAVATGNISLIADAVESLGVHNGGINRGRRLAEASAIRTGSTRGSDGSPSSNVSGFDYDTFKRSVDENPDPNERDVAYKMFDNHYKKQAEDTQRRENAVLDQGYKMIDQGYEPNNLPANLKIQLGRNGLEEMQKYKDNKIVDDSAYNALLATSVENPQAFMGISAIGFRSKMTSKQYADIIKRQDDMRKGGGKEAPYKVGISEANVFLKGLKIKDQTRIDQMGAQVIRSIDAFIRQNGRNPDYKERDQLIKELLTPLKVYDGWFGGSSSGRAFQTPYLDEGVKVKIDVKRDTIDPLIAKKYATTLQGKLGRPATDDEIVRMYLSDMKRLAELIEGRQIEDEIPQIMRSRLRR